MRTLSGTNTKYVYPKGSMSRLTTFHNIVEKVTGTFVRPIKNEYLMNTDGTLVYYYAGIAPDTNKSHPWDRVNKDSTLSDNRNKKNVCKHTDDNEGVCKDLRVKYHLGSSVASSLLPTVIIYPGFNDIEMRTQDLYVCEIPGLVVNAHLDIRN